MNRKMNRKIILGIVITCTVLVLADCSAQSMQVSMATPVEQNSSQSEKYVVLSNCGTLEELHRSLSEEVQVVRTITISDTAKTNDTGETIRLTDNIKAGLITQIEEVYQITLDEANKKVKQTELIVPGQRVRHFSISWKQQVFSSDISFNFDNQMYTASYTCALDIPQASQTVELICTG